jgi:protocatechuate 3,4-dioxygenase beta subunit
MVELADPDGDGRQTIFQEQSVRIRVDEIFKGIVSCQTIDLQQGGNDCAAKFRTGQRAVFYLYRDTTSGSWYVPPCTHSLGSAAPGGDDLLFLRKLPRSAKGTRLSGEVELYEDSPKESFRRVGGLPGIRVKISGPGGSSTEVMTNADGAYELYDLPPGRYSASIDVPKGLRIEGPTITGSLRVPGNQAAVELTANDGISMGFLLKADTQLTGRVLDAKGNPIRGVCVDLEPMEGRGENGARFFDCSNEGGIFAMEMMPPGQYRLVASDEVKMDDRKSKSTLYYPSERDREKATIVSIEAGKYVEHLNIRVPSDEKRYPITGRMQFEDGAPVADALVTFTSKKSGYSETTRTSADGSFGFLVVAEMVGQLRGQTGVFARFLEACPQFTAGRRVSENVPRLGHRPDSAFERF